MVIHNLDALNVVTLPDKTDAVLLIDANAVLSFPFAMQRLETIAWGNAEIRQ
jgi:hypothetical protein